MPGKYRRCSSRQSRPNAHLSYRSVGISKARAGAHCQTAYVFPPSISCVRSCRSFV